MLSDDRSFRDTSPIRFSVPRPERLGGYTLEELRQFGREARAELAKEARDKAAAAAGAAPPKAPDGKIANASAAAVSPPAPPAQPSVKAAGRAAEAIAAERERWRHACDWLELFCICRRQSCRRAAHCRGEPTACLRAGVQQAPEPAREFVRRMMQAQELGLPFDEAFEDAADCHDGYFGWLAGLAAAQHERRR
jgi:hypothetical protein